MNRLVAKPLSGSATNRIGALLFTTDGPLLQPGGRIEQLEVDLQLARARHAGLAIGLMAAPRTPAPPSELAALIRQLDDLFGPFDVVATCFHTLVGDPKCDCGGLAAGTVRAAAAALRLPPSRCLVVGAVPGDALVAAEAGAVGLVVSCADAVDLAIESVVAPDRALQQSVDALESTWNATC
ncbi:MAG: hydrolase, HAD-superfamily, subfamily [Acidimicrobiia bacterium]|nr:hydrolase, HAD-superfamily, subfamily [Acidimicrobiia bacterium]